MSLSEFSLRRSSVVYFVLMLFVVGGIWSFIRMGKKEDSTFVLKSAVVTCDYAGATPFEVEQLISEPVAREVQSMRRIKKITSESYYGHARIMVELESGVRAREIPQLWDELRRRVENISSSLPAAAGPLRVDDDISDVYGLYYALAADEGFSWDEIRSWAQQLKREIVAIDGVQKVALKGEQQPVVNIYITKSTLANFSISPEMIAATLSQQNNIVDTGEIDASQVRVRILEPATTSDTREQRIISAIKARRMPSLSRSIVKRSAIWNPLLLSAKRFSFSVVATSCSAKIRPFRTHCFSG